VISCSGVGLGIIEEGYCVWAADGSADGNNVGSSVMGEGTPLDPIDESSVG